MVSERSQSSTMVKNIVDVTVGGLTYWFLGYGLSFGQNTNASRTVVGASRFVVDEILESDEAWIYVHYFFQLSFATVSITIFSGDFF